MICGPYPKNPYKKIVNQKYKIRDHNLGYDFFFTNNFYTNNCYTNNFYTKNFYTKNPSAGSAGVWWPVLCSAAHAPAAAGGSVAFWAGGLGGALGLAVCRAGGRAARASAGPACRGGVGSALPAGGLARRPRPHPKKP